ncbi:GSCFA domain-containing protein [Croceibacterium sp. TMG7-5b_MA50]|uniref:GSCFA domain-containing protein n=1 Tax=Croceibacterium sp. TMG7-5b_MA50 TaxID=3121290 RepID=UPI003221E79D
MDPVTDVRFTIDRDARVATAGSCFAQHISRRISQSGYRYLVTEDGADLPAEERTAGGYGVFPARFGNIYTTVQLLQLFDEAFGKRDAPSEAWQRPDGRYVDSLRQQVEPRGFATPDCVTQDRARHLPQVRRMFEQADLFIFTLGLTEAWRSRTDGTVFSAAPGVVAGTFDPAKHEFVNFSVQESYAALREFLAKLREVNPAVKVVLTVSPVPLMATFSDRSVLVANSYSKSVLRVVAEMAVEEHDWVAYFPSYEIITGSFAGGLYYEADHREVNALGVAHAMRCFMRHYIAGGEDTVPVNDALFVDHQASQNVLCDEDVLDAARG